MSIKQSRFNRQKGKVKISEKQKKYIYSGGVAAAVVVVIIIAAFAVTQGGTIAPPVESEFGIEFYDGTTGNLIPSNASVNYTVFGADVLDDFDTFEMIKEGADIRDLSEIDFDGFEYPYYVINYSVLVQHDDTLYDDDFGPRFYYERWTTISITSYNLLGAFQMPWTTNAFIVDSETFAPVSIAEVNSTINVTYLISTNATQNDAQWVGGQNYDSEFGNIPTLYVNYNKTISLDVVSIPNAVSRRHNDSCIAYEFYMFNSNVLAAPSRWKASSIDTSVESAWIAYGDTTLAVIS